MAALPSPPRQRGTARRAANLPQSGVVPRAASIRPGMKKNRGPTAAGGGHGNKAHIGEVQSSLWDEANMEACEAAGVRLL